MMDMKLLFVALFFAMFASVEGKIMNVVDAEFDTFGVDYTKYCLLCFGLSLLCLAVAASIRSFCDSKNGRV